MVRVILLLLILNWPFNPAYLPEVLSFSVLWEEPSIGPCDPDGVVCYDSSIGGMRISPNPVQWKRVGGLERITFHELQHHLQYESGMYEANQWDSFRADVVGFYLFEHSDYTDHERATLRAHTRNGDKPWELHAELPLILEGEIPHSLQEWYPWFDWED